MAIGIVEEREIGECGGRMTVEKVRGGDYLNGRNLLWLRIAHILAVDRHAINVAFLTMSSARVNWQRSYAFQNHFSCSSFSFHHLYSTLSTWIDVPVICNTLSQCSVTRSSLLQRQ